MSNNSYEEGADVSPEEFEDIVNQIPLDKTERIISDGTRAETLLHDELLNQAFASVASRYHQKWANSAPGDVDAQRVAHAGLTALKEVQTAIRAYVSNAKVTIDRRNKRNL